MPIIFKRLRSEEGQSLMVVLRSQKRRSEIDEEKLVGGDEENFIAKVESNFVPNAWNYAKIMCTTLSWMLSTLIFDSFLLDTYIRQYI